MDDSQKEQRLLKDWLADDTQSPIKIAKDNHSTQYSGYTNTLLKAPLNDDIVLFYSQRNYYSNTRDHLVSEKAFSLGEGLKYEGFYSKAMDEIYDATRTEQMKKDIAEELSKLISDLIHHDREIVRGTPFHRLSNGYSEEDYELAACNRAVESFMTGKSLTYEPAIPWEEMVDQETLLSYLADPAWTLEELLEQWLEADMPQWRYDERHAEDRHNSMAAGLYLEDKAQEKLREAMEDPDHDWHKQKAIAEAIKAADAKTARVVIDKDGIDMAFTYDAHYLENRCAHTFSSYCIVAPAEREEYEARYGRWANNFTSADIVSMTYGRKEIYSREETVAKVRDALGKPQPEHEREETPKAPTAEKMKPTKPAKPAKSR